MKKYISRIFAIVLAIAFTTFSSFSKNDHHNSSDLMVRFVQGGNWSDTDEALGDAETSSGCPNGNQAICAQFYDVNHLNFNESGEVIGVKFIPGTTTPYPPDVTLRYTV